MITSDGGGATATVSVSENLSVVTTVNASDADLPAQSISYTVTGGADASKFTVDNSTGVLSFVTAPDYESPADANGDNIYEVIVQASDGAGGVGSQALSVTVTDNPQVYDQFNAISYSGNDGDENWLSNWTEIGESNGPSSGRVEVRSSGYMEIGGSEVSISGKGASRAADLSGATTAILDFDYRRVDNDGGGGSVSVQVSSNGGGSWTNLATYSLNSFDGSFKSATFDISAYASADTQIRFIGSGTTDAYFRFDNVSIEHNGTASNSAPSITSNGGGDSVAININENTVAVTTVVASDTDVPAQTLSYSIVGGDDATLFSIDNVTGALFFVAAPDYEVAADFDGNNVYDVIVRAADDAGGSDDQAFSVTIVDLDEFDVGAITDVDAAANAVIENASVGTAVGLTATAIDADGSNNTITYTLDDDAAGRFAIDGSTGVVTVADGTLLDREAAASHNIIVRATSSDGSFSTAGMTINVNDADEFDVGAVSDLDGASNEVSENAVFGTTVGITASASDADATTNAITYSLQDNDGGRFTIDSNTGVVTVAGTIDREAIGPTRNITVRATSADGSFTDQVFAIAINDVDEFDVAAVTDDDASANAVDENAANGTVVGVTALASDADATTNTITYTLDDSAGGRFAIDGSTGVVTVADGSLLDRESSASHNITVRATSSDGSFSAAVMTININDVDEFDVGAVTDTDGTTNEVAENVTVGTAVGITASASDADATTNAITYSLQDDDGGRFTIDASTGIVTVAGAIDREADGPMRNITVRATSADGSFTDQVFAITINDVDEFDVTVPTDVDTAADKVTENVIVGTTVGITADAFDLDATNNTITYSLTSNPDGLFTIDANTGVVSTAAAIDRETHGTTRSITVQAASSDGSVASQVLQYHDQRRRRIRCHGSHRRRWYGGRSDRKRDRRYHGRHHRGSV